MKELLATKKDGQNWKHLSIPFENSHIVEFKEDVTTYRYAYDDIEEIAEEIERICSRDDFEVFFKIENDKIDDVEVVSPDEFSDYSDYYVLHNGLMPVSEYIKMWNEVLQ